MVQKNNKQYPNRVNEKALENKKHKIAIIGLGHIGLPLAIEFSKKYSVVGLDNNKEHIQKISKTNSQDNLLLTSNEADLKTVTIFIITVPTSIDTEFNPDLKNLLQATKVIAKYIKKNAIVIYESTVYPGVTTDICGKILEKESGLTLNKDFFLGYSPERINIGDPNRTLTKITKVVSGSTEQTTQFLATLYNSILPEKIYIAPSIKIAEASKLLENTQRDLNIALLNEFSIIANKHNISTLDVIETAATKWNFYKVYPGLVGGPCLKIAPHYLNYLAKQVSYSAQLFTTERNINENIEKYIITQIIKTLAIAKKTIHEAKILIMSITFKENISDIRNIPIINIIRELHTYGITTFIVDPLANSDDKINLSNENDITLVDAVIINTPHKNYKTRSLKDILKKCSRPNRVCIDIKGIFQKDPEQKNCIYWSL